jgi:hypothetical protein
MELFRLSPIFSAQSTMSVVRLQLASRSARLRHWKSSTIPQTTFVSPPHATLSRRSSLHVWLKGEKPLAERRVHRAAMVYSLPFLVMRLVAGLLTVPNRVMVCWVCMVFLLLLGQSRHLPTGAKVAAPMSRHGRVAKRRSFWSGDPEPARGEESETRRARYASSKRRAAGRSSSAGAVAE